jgi:hypothetical protein
MRSCSVFRRDGVYAAGTKFGVLTVRNFDVMAR